MQIVAERSDRTDTTISEIPHWSYFFLSVGLICPIGLSPIAPVVLWSFLSGVIKPFGEAAFLEKGLFELTQLLVEKVGGLVNQA